MKLPIILTILVNIITTGAPNLCDDVYRSPTGAPYTDSIGQTLSRYCEWAGPDAPVWDANVCCTIDGNDARCSPTDPNGRCRKGITMYCEYAELVATGDVVCLQPLPDACEEGFCIQAPDLPPSGQAVYGACCNDGGGCQSVNDDSMDDCPAGSFIVCDLGVQNEDGTVDCYG